MTGFHYCLTNPCLGTTVRASVHIKLPKVSAKPEFKQICDEMKLQIRGIHGEHSESAEGVYDISNKQRLGLTEYMAVRQMYDGVKKLIELEQAEGQHQRRSFAMEDPDVVERHNTFEKHHHLVMQKEHNNASREGMFHVCLICMASIC
ncbi:hypothetical protein KIN20_016028 [Parelaphostrongylus tenuis]|uniref:arginine kinase n=1 Tax=Parelaphostrongylus tenuis TaxID=148309 RepID=A0AAD5N0Y3_PARTN|nr:hypothetical protein KIN20_016028 [Parelaphostrongylus tenuis]